MAQMIVHVQRTWHNSENVHRKQVVRDVLAAVDVEGPRAHQAVGLVRLQVGASRQWSCSLRKQCLP